MMEPFQDKFLEIAKKETRCVIIPPGNPLPAGEYLFMESYCNDNECDCCRVFLNVLYQDKILATIGYGWKEVSFYEEWMGDKRFAADMKGPTLELCGSQSQHAEEILRLFKEFLLNDEVFIERLKRHYQMFKEKQGFDQEHSSENEVDDDLDSDEESEIQKQLENFNPEEHSVLKLCEDEGTGIEAINDDNNKIFMPLLMAIEETIWKYCSGDSSIKDKNIIESLKKIRDNLFSEEVEFNELEDEIIAKVKAILFFNHYDKRDLSLSISKVLNSAKRHRSMDGKKGYIRFISEFFEEMG